MGEPLSEGKWGPQLGKGLFFSGSQLKDLVYLSRQLLCKAPEPELFEAQEL